MAKQTSLPAPLSLEALEARLAPAAAVILLDPAAGETSHAAHTSAIEVHSYSLGVGPAQGSERPMESLSLNFATIRLADLNGDGRSLGNAVDNDDAEVVFCSVDSGTGSLHEHWLINDLRRFGQQPPQVPLPSPPAPPPEGWLINDLRRFGSQHNLFAGGVRVAIGDVNGDGFTDVIVSRAPDLKFAFDGPIICQALFQRLAPRAPQPGPVTLGSLPQDGPRFDFGQDLHKTPASPGAPKFDFGQDLHKTPAAPGAPKFDFGQDLHKTPASPGPPKFDFGQSLGKKPK